jgi:FAD/FMN-containing dehydrogenase
MEAALPAIRILGDRTGLDDFARSIRGEVIRPGDAAYDVARQVHNRAFDRRPAVIVRAADADDVASTVALARETGLELAVRSGGHSLAGHGTGDDAIVIDLSSMKALHIDPERRLAWAEAGLTAGEYTVAAAAHGLATPFGDAASVGLGGITTGGGVGWLTRKLGMTIDSLVAVDLVTADGRQVTVSEDEHPDLFWAVRGGGGNFGVVTRFQFRLHPVDTILGGALFLPLTEDVLRGLVPIAASAPEELTTIASVMRIPPLPFVAPELHGELAVIVMAVYAGDPDAGQRAVAPFRALATPLAEALMPMPYPAIYRLTEAASTPGPNVTRSSLLDVLDDSVVDTIVERMRTASSPMAMTQIRVLGGAMARVPTGATAYAHRDRTVMLTVITPYEDPADGERHAEWTTAYAADLAPHAVGAYANFLADEAEWRVHEAYPGATYRRLVRVKRRYDPTNLFHLNQNIRPFA